MSKQRRDLTRTCTTKVKKSRGVGSCTITILDSDNEQPLPTTTNKYARVTKTRVASSGKAEKVSTDGIQIFEAEVEVLAPLEVDTNLPVDTENIVYVVPARKQRKRANNCVSCQTLNSSVSLRTFQTKMYSWLDVRSNVIDEVVCLDGPGDLHLDLCASCLDHQPTSLYRCLKCSHSSLYCDGCIVELHRALPLHQIGRAHV